MKWLVKRFFKPFAKAMLQHVVGELADFVIYVVRTLMTVDNLTSEEKRKQAFEAIKAEAKRRRVALKDSAINLAIELAVQLIKHGW
jgi:hypothetical protein